MLYAHEAVKTADMLVLQAGHALAAASEGVGVQHLGAFTLLLMPGAYVALDSGALAALRPWRTLRVSPAALPGHCYQNEHKCH